MNGFEAPDFSNGYDDLPELPKARALPEETHHQVMELEPEMLPDEIWGFVADTCDRQQSPPDFVAMAALCSLSGVLGRKLLIQPKTHDTGWRVTTNLWGALIGPPSSMKSPTLKAATAPLHRLEREAKENYEQEVKDAAVEKELNALEAKRLRDEAKKAGKDVEKARHCMEKAIALESESTPPTLRRLIVNDASVEKLGELLNENPNGLILIRDELSGWLAKLNASDAGQERAFYLEAYNGDGSFTYDRIGRGTVRIESCTLAMMGGIQPSKLMPLVRGATTGQADDGLLQRLQLAVYPEPSSSWQWRDKKPDSHAAASYEAIFKRLDSLPRFNPDTPDDVPIMRLSEDALGLFAEWSEDLQNTIRASSMGEAMQSHHLKMPQTVIRLAGLFSTIAEEESVNQREMLRALALSDYLRSHASKIYGLANDASLHGARLILERSDKLGSPFSLRDLYRKCWTGLASPSDAAAAIDLLIEHGHVIAFAANQVDSIGRPSMAYSFTGVGL